ncbi:restriction endonuclease subunit S [uncultured Megamonas sp.]|uniref:restriction endonuclease subunit S n=1 Tax=uncultured Megamonas sp. TaxID=286140 RepID=UPI00259B7F67|nr:restriction endonuclease subunit S [uncultured Megamonas sp.]
MNIPKLRFKDNNGNDYPQWEKKKLGDLVSIKTGISPTNILDEYGSIPYFKVEQLNNSNKYQINTPYKTKNNQKLIPPKSIIFPKRGISILSNKIRILSQYSLIDTNIMALIVKNNSTSNEFLYYFLLNEDLSKIADTTSIPQINNKHIEPYNIYLPLLDEQEKIANFLTTVDKKIENLANTITSLENQKKGLLQQIFSQKLRFKDKNGNNYPNWEKKKLGDIANSFDYGMNAPSKEFDGINKYIRITDIDEITHKFINKNIVSPNGILDNKYLVNKNDILFARTGASTGKTYIYDTNDGILYFAGFLIRANIPEKYNSYFIFLNTLTQKYKNWVKIESTRSGQPGINAEQYKSYNVFVPCLEEQTKIADFLSAFDRKLDNQKTQLEHWQQIKKGLLQQMFV